MGDYSISYPRAASAQQLAPALANGLGVPFTLYVNCPSGGAAGTADDVVVFSANAPFPFRILDRKLYVSTAVAAATAQLRSATAGGGSTLSSAMSVASTGLVLDASTTTNTVAAGGTLVLRRSDRSMVGELFLTCIRT